METQPQEQTTRDRTLRAHQGWLVAAAAVVPIVLGWLMSLAGTGLANTTAAIALVLPVVAAAATGVRWAGAAAALGAAAAFDYFLTAPFRTLRISDPVDLETAALLLVVGLAVSEIAVRSRRHQARLSREQGYLEALLQTAGAAAAGSATAGQLVEVVRQQLTDLLGLDACRFDPATAYGLPHLGADGGLLRRGGWWTSVGSACPPTRPSRYRSVPEGSCSVTSCSRRPPGCAGRHGSNSGSP